MATGTLKWFNEQKGYGFIQPDQGGKDVFVHISAVERSHLRTKTGAVSMLHHEHLSEHVTSVRVWPFRAGLGVGAREGRGAGNGLSWWVPAKSRHHVFPTVPFRRGNPNLRAAVPAAANLEPRWDAADRRDPGPWPTHCDEPVADHGAERGAALRQLPPRAQPRGLEQPCGIPLAVRVADHHPHARGAGGAGPGRHDRAPPRQAYLCQGHLP